jgi:hypothetical protein
LKKYYFRLKLEDHNFLIFDSLNQLKDGDRVASTHAYDCDILLNICTDLFMTSHESPNLISTPSLIVNGL